MELIQHRHKRWVWTQLEAVPGFTHPQPIAREYAFPWVAPMVNREWELMIGHFSLIQLAAARKDHRLIVLDGLQSPRPIPTVVAEGMAEFGVTPDMCLYDMLHHLGETVDPQFYPEH